MVAATRTPRRDSIAIAGSIAVHLCVLAVALATLPRASFPVDDPDERTLLTTILHVERRPPPHVAPVHRALAAIVPAPDTRRPVIHAAVTVEHASRQMVVASEHRAGAVPAPRTSQRPEPVRGIAMTRAVMARPTAAAVPESAATAAPAAPPAPSPVVAQHEEGIGNFGETYPAAIDPSARGSVFAGVNGVVVRITVDENGRPTSIEFVRSPADSQLREELRTRLLAARFIPAACNGLRCAGTLELKN
jgi:TonB family protein